MTYEMYEVILNVYSESLSILFLSALKFTKVLVLVCL